MIRNIKNFYIGGKLFGTYTYGQICIGYHNLETGRCVYFHFFPERKCWLWGRCKDKDLFYDCVFYKMFYFGPFLMITWSSDYE